MTQNGKAKRGFAAMDPNRQREIASKGGKASGGNFANDRSRAAEAGRVGGKVSRSRASEMA
ncbi:general stress protein [Sphingomonas sp. KRR8]|uniref:general stress protein n=1 Tax=Sphingomonas sp. KRR8 TaxID=2942996 RepID=UPI0020219B30|nr:general stress protein [Sphingomonas sp. KRR8]URD60522.1 general stress protein [Sphingomonas sp. KRR8]